MMTCSLRFLPIVVWVAFTLPASSAWADGKVVPPRDYQGSLEERSQEAIIIFDQTDDGGQEDLILKIQVAGQTDHFAWVVPFPNEPQVSKEDPGLFPELFGYVEARLGQTRSSGNKSEGLQGADAAPKAATVEVLSRQVVGNFEIAVVRETEQGGLNPWLEGEGYQRLDDADDVLNFYRDKGYVFACIKVSAAAADESGEFESHPLRFTFATGGRDGIYFPMKMTGLQTQPFDVNLYVFYGAWLNDRLSQFGYEHRGFRRRFRDWDSSQCEPNAGKTYSLPQEDPYLRDQAHRLKLTTKLFQKLHPGNRYYLTNIQASGLAPADVRAWADDLWMFPYYVNRAFVPFDARPGGAAHTAWPHVTATEDGTTSGSGGGAVSDGRGGVHLTNWWRIAVAALALATAGGIWWIRSRRIALGI